MTITEAKTQTITVTVPALDVINALKNAAPFAEKNGFAPILSGIHLVVRDGQLLAEATDRYKVGQIKIGKPEDVAHLSDDDGRGVSLGVVPAGDVKAIEAALKSPMKNGPEFSATITVEDGIMTFECEFSGGRARPFLISGEFPSVHKLFEGEVGDAGHVAINPVHLKVATGLTDHRVTAAKRRDHALTMRQQGGPYNNKPMIFTATTDTGEAWARSMVMPLVNNGHRQEF